MTNEWKPIFDQNSIYEHLESEDKELIKLLYEEYLVQLNDLSRFMTKFGPASATTKEMSFFAHRLKSSSGVVGANQLEAAIRVFEQAANTDPYELQALFSTISMLLEPTRCAIEIAVREIHQ